MITIARKINGKVDTATFNSIDEDILQSLGVDGWRQVTVQNAEQTIPENVCNFRDIYSLNEETNILTISKDYDLINLSEYKEAKKIILKNNYLEDVLWTDDAKLFYDKFKAAYSNDTTKDSWWADVLVFWAEARLERELNKTAIESVSSISEIDAVNYSPIHVKSKAELNI